MCKIRFVCKSKSLGGGGASGLVRVGGADGIFCPSLGGEGVRNGGDAGLAGSFHWYRGPENKDPYGDGSSNIAHEVQLFLLINHIM